MTDKQLSKIQRVLNRAKRMRNKHDFEGKEPNELEWYYWDGKIQGVAEVLLILGLK